jgi:hypothetical protein
MTTPSLIRIVLGWPADLDCNSRVSRLSLSVWCWGGRLILSCNSRVNRRSLCVATAHDPRLYVAEQHVDIS